MRISLFQRIALTALFSMALVPAFSQEAGDAAPAVPFPQIDPAHARLGEIFYVADPQGRDTVTVTSRAPLEDIVGITNDIVGYLAFDPHHPLLGGRGKFRVSAKSIDTGIALRNEHLQGPDWLDAENHPFIEFTIENTRDVELIKEGEGFRTYNVTLIGPLTIKGVTKQKEIDARATYLQESEKTKAKMPGDLVVARASFEIRLRDFNVTGPQDMDVIGSRVSDTVKIELSFTATNKRPDTVKLDF